MASTTGKNRSILAGLVAPAVTETPTLERGAPATERLTTRLTGLARVTAGDIKEKTLKLVDPARCRMWERHNRRYDLLNESVCGDLLESLRSQGEQEFPAIVRRVEDDPAFDFEVICGARRHWAVSYLKNVEHRDIRYLVEERELRAAFQAYPLWSFTLAYEVLRGDAVNNELKTLMGFFLAVRGSWDSFPRRSVRC